MTTTEIRAYVTFAPAPYRQHIEICDSGAEDAAVDAIEAAVRAAAQEFASGNNIVLAGWKRLPDHEAADHGVRVVLECDDDSAFYRTSILQDDMTDALSEADSNAVMAGAWLDEEAA